MDLQDVSGDLGSMKTPSPSVVLPCIPPDKDKRNKPMVEIRIIQLFGVKDCKKISAAAQGGENLLVAYGGVCRSSHGFQWDPTGRYLTAVTSSSNAGNRKDNGFTLYSFQDRYTRNGKVDGLSMLGWRPKPAPSILPVEKLKDIKKNLKECASEFEIKDRLLALKASKEVSERRKRLVTEFTDFLTTKLRYLEQKRVALERGYKLGDRMCCVPARKRLRAEAHRSALASWRVLRHGHVTASGQKFFYIIEFFRGGRWSGTHGRAGSLQVGRRREWRKVYTCDYGGCGVRYS
ncbi:uncharacterized protein LOC129589420 [Paramacrobiotus metropolitanus]|uniref:uncharacterized protein LOC129589420 n=1 Tax=Paramacrobiotus metropolitanus TaxID=2943436 RepID=UPI0024461D78|nr:uncharacterized protein LOC129589420 [Paramacrobiotus metropolitanus]